MVKKMILLYLLIGLGCSSPPDELPRYEVMYLRAEPGEISIIAEPENTTINIISQSGIGSGRIELSQGSWPESLIIHLHLKGLEGFTVTAGNTQLNISDLQMMAYDKNGELYAEKYLMDNAGFYEVILPRSLLNNGITSFELEWVDFYR